MKFKYEFDLYSRYCEHHKYCGHKMDLIEKSLDDYLAFNRSLSTFFMSSSQANLPNLSKYNLNRVLASASLELLVTSLLDIKCSDTLFANFLNRS